MLKISGPSKLKDRFEEIYYNNQTSSSTLDMDEFGRKTFQFSVKNQDDVDNVLEDMCQRLGAVLVEKDYDKLGGKTIEVIEKNLGQRVEGAIKVLFYTNLPNNTIQVVYFIVAQLTNEERTLIKLLV